MMVLLFVTFTQTGHLGSSFFLVNVKASRTTMEAAAAIGAIKYYGDH